MTASAWQWGPEVEARGLLSEIEELALSALGKNNSADAPDVAANSSFDDETRAQTTIGAVHTNNADHVIIAAAREELSGNAPTLLRLLDRLDDLDRAEAYSALYHVVHAVQDIAWQAMVPVGGKQQQREDDAGAYRMRKGKAAKKAPREGIIREAIKANEDKPPKEQRHLINTELKANGHRPISSQALRRLKKIIP